jgi:uncharacterized protein
MGNLGRRVRHSVLAWLGKLLAIRDTPEAMARGLAVGFFFGVSFLWGLQIVLAVLVAHLLRGNKVLAAALTAVSNPLTSLPLYGLCYWLGQLVIGGHAAFPDLSQLTTVSSLLALGPRFFLAMLVGSALLGLVGGLILYFSANRLFVALRGWHARRALGSSSASRTDLATVPAPAAASGSRPLTEA